MTELRLLNAVDRLTSRPCMNRWKGQKSGTKRCHLSASLHKATLSQIFAPSLYDVGGRDNRSVMDVAVFRLSKKDKRAGELIRYDLPDGYVEVSAGAHGMASVWDYDIVLMMVSHLTEAMNRYREGKGGKPGRVFRLHVSDILRFARRGNGSSQVKGVEAALDRLRGTTIKTVRESGKFRTTEAEGLIARYRVLSRTDTKKISSVEIEAPEWIYREVTEGKRPEVLTVHRDYFLIEPGIGRFIYRLARRAAGRDSAKWAFKTLYERSGSGGSFKNSVSSFAGSSKPMTCLNMPCAKKREGWPSTGHEAPQSSEPLGGS